MFGCVKICFNDPNVLSPAYVIYKNPSTSFISSYNDDISDEINNTSTMKSILNQTNAIEIDNNIRQEINEQFASEKNTDSKVWENETEILDSIAESERLRNERLGIIVEETQDVPTTKIKNKKKKRFFFF